MRTGAAAPVAVAAALLRAALAVLLVLPSALLANETRAPESMTAAEGAHDSSTTPDAASRDDAPGMAAGDAGAGGDVIGAGDAIGDAIGDAVGAAIGSGAGGDQLAESRALSGPREAPVISAPDDPGRMAPGLADALPEAGTFNSFATGTMMAPPVAALSAASVAPVVVEMFTSQGCSSCPPADAMLAGIASQPDVLALSYHIDYWDYLGWADSFARPEFTARQEAYARAARERAIYTPQIIVGGHDTLLAPGPAQLGGLIDAARVAPSRVSVQRESLPSGEAIELQPLSDLGGRVEILMVRYVPFRAVEVTEGENRGRSVSYSNVVVALERLADWDGQRPLRLTVRAELDETGRFPGDTRHALLVQQMQKPANLPGPILAAIRLD